jgi:hypothetical protein
MSEGRAWTETRVGSEKISEATAEIAAANHTKSQHMITILSLQGVEACEKEFKGSTMRPEDKSSGICRIVGPSLRKEGEFQKNRKRSVRNV